MSFRNVGYEGVVLQAELTKGFWTMLSGKRERKKTTARKTERSEREKAEIGRRKGKYCISTYVIDREGRRGQEKDEEKKKEKDIEKEKKGDREKE